MKMLLTLLKNEFLKISKINLIRYGDAKKRQRTICLYLVVCMAAFAFLYSYASKMRSIFLLSWTEDGIISALIVPMAIICLILNIAVSVLWGSGLLLSDTNADAQLALPIHLSTLTIAKLFVLYAILALLNILLLFPMTVLFGLAAGAGTLFYLIMTGNILLSPIIPCLLGTMIGTGIYRILRKPSALAARLKAMLAILFLLVYMAFMFWKFFNTSKESRSSYITTELLDLGCRYTKSLLQHNMLSLTAYLASILLAGSLLLHSIIAVYRNWYCNAVSRKAISAHISSKAFTPNKTISALIKRERRRYFTTPVYLTNTACGFLFAIVFVLLVGMTNDKIAPYIDLLGDYFQIDPAKTNVLYVYALTILISLSGTTYASISIEGEQIEVLKSLPVSAQEVFRAKILFHLSLSVPVIFILNTVMALLLQYPWYTALLGYIMPLSFSAFVGMTGYIFNLLFPNFEWDNITQIIKQSLPAMLNAIFSTFATCGAAYLILKYFSDIVIFGSFMACIGIILIVCGMGVFLFINFLP